MKYHDSAWPFLSTGYWEAKLAEVQSARKVPYQHEAEPFANGLYHQATAHAEVSYNTLDDVFSTCSLTRYLASGEDSLRLEVNSYYSVYTPSTSKTPSHDADAERRLLESNACLVVLGDPRLLSNASRRWLYKSPSTLTSLSPSTTPKKVTVDSLFAMRFLTSRIVLVPLIFSVVALPAITQDASKIISDINAIGTKLTNAADLFQIPITIDVTLAIVSQLKFTLRSILPILIPFHV